MLFDVEEDLGNRIVGYLVPDSYSMSSMLSVSINGTVVAAIETDDVRSSVVAAGRHSTGRCGFVLTEDNVPNLSRAPFLEISEKETGLVIYRRRPPDSVSHGKLFRLETSCRRMKDLDLLIDGKFQLPFLGVDTFGRETTAQSFLLSCTDSLFVSARLLYREYEYSIDSSFRKVCVIQDPFVELSETILTLCGNESAAALNFREKLAMDESIQHFSGLDSGDIRMLKARLLRMPDSVATVVSNPLVRLLAARTADEMPNSTFVPSSLETLASFDIVGIRERPDSYCAPISQLLGVEVGTIPVQLASKEAMELADALRKWPAASRLLDMDLEIYAAVRAAVATGF